MSTLDIPVELQKHLDLSELNEMDFSILVKKFPPTHVGDVYSGAMTLTGSAVEHLLCDGCECPIIPNNES